MITLILLIVFGFFTAILSIQNTVPVPVSIFFYTFPPLPLFFVIIASMLLGVLLSYVIHLVSSISNAFTIRGKNQKIKSEREELAQLTKKLHQLELENARLQENNSGQDFETKSL